MRFTVSVKNLGNHNDHPPQNTTITSKKTIRAHPPLWATHPRPESALQLVLPFHNLEQVPRRPLQRRFDRLRASGGGPLQRRPRPLPAPPSPRLHRLAGRPALSHHAGGPARGACAARQPLTARERRHSLALPFTQPRFMVLEACHHSAPLSGTPATARAMTHGDQIR